MMGSFVPSNHVGDHGPHDGLSIIEQYAKRQAAARQNWSLHMLCGMVPFCAFLWVVQSAQQSPGPRRLAILAWLLFAVCLGHGAYRYWKIDRCPACDASRFRFYVYLFGISASHSTSNSCESCGAELIAK